MIAANPILKIHPAIGVARIGDAPTAFFIGPERPLAGNTGLDGVGSKVPSYRDGGKIKRQAARFRVYHYPPGKEPEELTLDHPEVKAIEWTVHLANKKPAFFEFQGQLGAVGPYLGEAPNLRNKSIAAAERAAKLMIDPGPRSIDGVSAGPVLFDSSTGNWPKDLGGAPVIDFLGELHTDAKGRLLVLGARGKSGSSNALPVTDVQLKELRNQGYTGPAVGTTRPPAPLLEYANNDSWFDDISDGPVTAEVTLKNGKKVTVKAPAWVLVAPPDFAPEIRSVVSMYDTMLDVAIRSLPDPVAPFYSPEALLDYKALKKSFDGTPGFQPEWFHDIQPTILGGLLAKYVHEAVASSHGTLDVASLKNTVPSPSPKDTPFSFLRPPVGNTTYSGPGSMPKLFGDNYFIPADPKRVVSVTQLQFHILTLWKNGKFKVGTPGPTAVITPQGLDRAALESCVGAAFFPGIEASWLVRDKRLYSEPFRIKHNASIGPLTVGPGFFSQQMALPWQADFLDCAKDDSTLGVFFGWWPAQRPDDVYLNAADAAAETNMKPWDRGVEASGSSPRGASHLNMVHRWNQLGFVVSAAASGRTVYIEQDRTLP